MNSQNIVKHRALLITLRLGVLVALVLGTALVYFHSSGRLPDLLDSKPQPLSVQPQDSVQQSASSGPRMFTSNPTMLVITDSLGVYTDDQGRVYQDVLGDELGWDIISDAVPARGYSATDLNVIGIDRVVPPVISTLGYDAEHYKPDFVYVDLGRNDLGKDPAVVEPAMVDYLTKLRDSYPRAVITVVLPCPMESNPKVLGTWPVLTPKIRTAAEGIGAQVLDPLTEGWYRTVDLIPMQLEDHVHLNSRGAEFYGKKVAQVLRSRGITDMRPSGS